MIVVDAALVVNAIADSADAGAAARDRIRRATLPLHAPHLLDAEVLSVLRRRSVAGLIADEQALVAIEDLVALPVRRHPNWTLLARAWELRHNFTAYDALYLALAERFRCPLVTFDAKVANAPNLPCEVELVAA